MSAWIARRVLGAVAILWAVATLAFVAVQAAPGEPFLPSAERPADPAAIERLRRQFGLDQPLTTQYVRYLGRLVHGDLGMSFSQRRPVADALAAALPHTLLLALAALLVDFTLGLALGLVQAARAGRRLDVALTNGGVFLASMPTFWLGLVLILVFAEWLRWLPAGGAYDPAVYSALSAGGKIVDRLRHLALPALTLGLVGAAGTARFQRAALLEALTQSYIHAARAKGLSEPRVLLVHALRNALLPAITLFGLSLPFLLTGAVLVESVFAWPGLGRLAADAIAARDYPLVAASAIVASLVVAAGSLAADLLTAAADPRIRVEA